MVFTADYLEITGFISGVLGVYLTLKQKTACFPVGLLNVGISLVLFYRENLFADALQQVVYILLLLYGWYAWLHPGKHPVLPVTQLRSREALLVLFSIFGCALTLGYVLATYTHAELPWTDAAASSIAFAAQYLVARKKLENWHLWILVNIAYIAIYLYKELPLYTLLSILYLALAIAGLIDWKKKLVSA